MNKSLAVAIGLSLAFLSYGLFANQQRLADAGVPQEVSNMFQSWIVKHQKEYQTPSELLHRLEQFAKNYIFVQENNKNAKVSGGATLELNMYADLSANEFLPLVNDKEASDSQEKASTEDRQEITPQIELGQQPIKDSTNWEYQKAGDKLLFPEFGRWNGKCLSDNFAYAAYYAVTAAHSLANNLLTPTPVSYQYFIDCKLERSMFYHKCVDQYTRKDAMNKILGAVPLFQEYPTSADDQRADCKKVGLQQQPVRRPTIFDFTQIGESDGALEGAVAFAPVLGQVKINPSFIQLYKSGVIFDNQCGTGDIAKYINVVISGYSRSGTDGAGPFW